MIIPLDFPRVLHFPRVGRLVGIDYSTITTAITEKHTKMWAITVVRMENALNDMHAWYAR